MKFSKKDFWFSIFTGLGAGLISWRIFSFLEVLSWRKFSFVWLALIVPILWMAGVNLGYFLGRWIKFFNQFGKFVAIGFTNAAVDFGVLNYLIAVTGVTAGVYYSVLKVSSFLVALVNSYFLNKYWAFEAGQTGVQGEEFAKFASVAVAAALLNVSTASYIVNFINPIFGLSSTVWANVGAVFGSASALVISFIGFKLLVFKKKKTDSI